MSAYTSLLIYQLKDLLPLNIFSGNRDTLPSLIANSKHLCIYALGLRRSPGEGKGYTFQYSGLENSMDCIIYGVANSGT